MKDAPTRTRPALLPRERITLLVCVSLLAAAALGIAFLALCGFLLLAVLLH